MIILLKNKHTLKYDDYPLAFDGKIQKIQPTEEI